MALTVTVDQVPNRQSWLGHSARHSRLTSGTITFDSSYATGGEAIAAANVALLRKIDAIMFDSEDGFVFKYDKSNAKVMAFSPAITPSTSGIINDDNSAATNGADLQIAISDHVANAIEENAWNGLIGRFEAINGGNADVHTNQVGTAVSATNPTYSVWDNDNAETETGVMADVFCAPAGGGFYAVTLSGLDTYVPLSNGEFIKVTYDADPATNQSAVQVYYDHDATNAHERMLCVAADNADETYTVATELSLRASQSNAGMTEVASATDLSGVVVRYMALGQ
jgi:hypothetical protein